MLWQPGETLGDQFRIDSLGCRISICEKAVSASFDSPRLFVSSSVHNGGSVQASHYVNLSVKGGCSSDDIEPCKLFSGFSQAHQIDGAVVGMMTAASMRSARIVTERVKGETLLVLLTTGMANARCAGDSAEYRELYETSPQKAGTINIFVAFSAPIQPTAMIEAHAIITETKCSVMQDRVILSPLSGKIATGTGTDAIAVASPRLTEGDQSVRFLGKHTLLGERLSQCVNEALTSSLDYYVLNTSANLDQNRPLIEL